MLPHGVGGRTTPNPGPPYRREGRRESSVPPIIHSRSTPRQIRIERKDNGFGFTLRHFIVYPPEEGSGDAGPPIQEPMDTIFVKSVKDRGPAVLAGLNIGDRLVSVNGETVSGRTYAQVVQMIQKSRDSLFLVVVPRQDDILQVYFSEIAQNPESNRRLESTPGPAASMGPSKPPWPASVCSSSSRESSPFSSKTSDSTRDSVYGHNKEYGVTRGSAFPTQPSGKALLLEEGENIYATIGPPTKKSSPSLEHIYAAVPAMAGSTVTLTSSETETSTARSRHNSDSDSSILAGFTPVELERKEEEQQSSILANFHAQLNKIKQECDVVKLPPEPPKPEVQSEASIMAGYTSQLNKIRRDCQVKEDFIKNKTIPAYMSRDGDDKDERSPYRIASLTTTMPPPKEPSPDKPPAKNFFMDIYAQEVSKMKSESTSAPVSKKRNFDATHFNAYGLPLGYRKGNTYDMDSFSRNNYVIVGSRTLHCEPPQVYQPTPDPPAPEAEPLPAPPAPDDEAEKALRRTSYMQATKEAPMDVEENLASETGLAPTHSIKKLKSIFSEKEGEKASQQCPPPLPAPPSEVHLNEVMKTPETSISPTEAPEIKLREGYLTCKVAVVDGKKANDRSWKTVYAVLKSKTLYMYKDKKMATDNLEYEEKPVKLVESEVEVANDYTKRKNVFRVKTDAGGEYLFQAENESLMKEWVQVIDKAAMAIIVDERKDSNKLRKLTSFRNRSPTGQSPASKSRKSSAEVVPPYKDKDKKTLKGKLMKKLNKIGGSHGPLYPEGGSIGVPLEECPTYPGSGEEGDTWAGQVPYLVKVCCDIVNEKGLDIVGIYRVPGNNAAVTYLTEQINKGIDYFALEDQRWQDVNVVSSLLKSFFRKLPEPLFTVEYYALFIEASKIDVPSKRLEVLRKLIRDLPEIHLETLKYLMSHLCMVAEHAALNKMEVRNLAIVFGPTLVRTTDDNMVSMVTDMSQQCRIIESLLSNWEYFFTEEEVEPISENPEEPAETSSLMGGVSNTSLMLANLQKLEDAGKMSSPKGDVSAKDIVSSIISAANRKMLRAATKGKKESSVEFESERCTSVSRDNLAEGARRESEAVIHGALQIASAVPGLMGSLSTGSIDSCRNSPEPDGGLSFSRQSSSGGGGRRGSTSTSPCSHGARRGSLQYDRPTCQSKRGSICAYTGGAMCDVTPIGELCETRVAMMAEEKGTVTNGHGENQEVVTGKLSLVNVPGYPRVTSGEQEAPLRPDSAPPARTSLSPPSLPQLPEYKFPIETYAGLDRANAERIAKFEAETKAMLTQRSGLGRSSGDLSSQHGSSSPARSDLSTASTGPSLPSLPSLATCSLSSLPGSPDTRHASLLAIRTTPIPAHLTSLTTPVPDASNPLEGGILMEEPYHTEAYNTPLSVPRHFLNLTYRNSLPNLQPAASLEDPELAGKFDTMKVAARGTLQRMKVKDRQEVEEVEQKEDTSHTEQLLNNLTASFDQKMRLLLDPNYQAASTPVAPDSGRRQLEEARSGVAGRQGRRVELRRTGRVDRRWPSRSRDTDFNTAVLREANTRTSRTTDSLTKQEKTELNLKAKAEKENSKGGVTALRDQFEQRALRESQTSRVSTKPEVAKQRKKFGGRGLRRRHTVGGTKDFSATVVDLLVRGAEAWDRLAPLVSDQKLHLHSAEVLRGGEEGDRRLSLPAEEQGVGWRYSLPGLV